MADWHKISLEKLAKQEEVPEGMIRLSGPLERDNIVNGDGLRAVLWTQGCPNHCIGLYQQVRKVLDIWTPR